jgi:hypothetical protein
MSNDGRPCRVTYYRTEERTETGEAVFHLRFYGTNGRWQNTKPVPASLLKNELDALRRQHIPALRMT